MVFIEADSESVYSRIQHLMEVYTFLMGSDPNECFCTFLIGSDPTVSPVFPECSLCP